MSRLIASVRDIAIATAGAVAVAWLVLLFVGSLYRAAGVPL